MNQTHKLYAMVVVFATIAILVGCTKKPSVDVTVEKNKSLVQRYFDEMNKGNKSYLDEYFGAKYIYHGSAGDLDAEGVKAQHDMFLTAFTDVKASVEDIIAVGDKVVTRWKILGTHSGELQGIAPTGKEVTITGIIITRVDNGKAVEEWEAFDQLGLMQQIGAIPLPQNTNQ
ncbi:MAG: ester cyclase [Calditrichia bacterium]